MRLMVLTYVYEQVLRRVQWKGQKDWLLSAPGTWALDAKPAGFVRAHQNLEYLIGKLIPYSCELCALIVVLVALVSAVVLYNVASALQTNCSTTCYVCTSVLDAGHMVPMDQPAVALSMIGTFLQNKRYAAVTSQNKLGVALDAPGTGNERCERTPSTGGVPAAPDSSSGSAASPLGLGFWPSSGGVPGKVQHVRRQRVGRRNDHSAVVNSNPIVTAAQGGRQLLSEDDELRASGDGNGARNSTARSLQQQATPAFSLVLGHVTPLNGSALAHVKLVHQTHAPHLQHHQHTDHTAVRTALSGYQLALAVQPGNLIVPVDVATLLSKHLTADVVVAGLQDGVEYSFSTVFIDQQGVKQAASKRVVTATPGCFNPSFVQCCGNGHCVSGSAQAYCKCDEGYTGAGCDVIAPHPQASTAAPHVLDTAVTCPAHFHAHLALVHELHTTTEALATEQAGMHQPNRAGTNVSRGLSATEQLRYCGSSLAGSGNTAHPSAALCRVSIQVQLQLSSSGVSSGIVWPSQPTVTKHYATAVAVLLGADISAALARVVSGQDVTDIMHVTSGGVARQPGDSVVLGGTDVATSVAHEQSGVVRLTVRLLGPAKRVDAVAGQLVEQLQQSTSILRTEGVVGQYLSQDIVVVSHKDAEGQGVEGIVTVTGPQRTRGSSTRSSDGAAPPKKNKRMWLYVVIAIVAGCGVVCCVAGMRSGPRDTAAVRHIN
jgi:hypothetical protein